MRVILLNDDEDIEETEEGEDDSDEDKMAIMVKIVIVQGDFFNWSRPKCSKCWRWQNPYQKSESLS